MTLTVHWPRSTRIPESRDIPSAPKRSEAHRAADELAARNKQAAPSGQLDWRREVVLLALVLLGIAIFFAGYAAGRHDDTFRTSWYAPLRGTSAAPQTIGSVQGGPIEPAGNTPLLVTVRGLRILPANEHYVLYVLDAKRVASRCGAFSVGEGTTQVHLSYPGLQKEPYGWKIARERKNVTGIGKIVARTTWH
jgi:hypothetical protein